MCQQPTPSISTIHVKNVRLITITHWSLPCINSRSFLFILMNNVPILLLQEHAMEKKYLSEVKWVQYKKSGIHGKKRKYIQDIHVQWTKIFDVDCASQAEDPPSKNEAKVTTDHSALLSDVCMCFRSTLHCYNIVGEYTLLVVLVFMSLCSLSHCLVVSMSLCV